MLYTPLEVGELRLLLGNPPTSLFPGLQAYVLSLLKFPKFCGFIPCPLSSSQGNGGGVQSVCFLLNLFAVYSVAFSLLLP